VGEGVVVDFSRHMANMLSAPEENAIWVQPGVVLDDLNDYLRPLCLQFPIDISTSSRCTIGGMMGNNAAGSHSIVYGTTRENVLEVDAVLSDATMVRFGPLDAQSLKLKQASPGLEGDIYRTVFDIVDSHRETILAAYPDPTVIRRNTGYALDALALGQPWVVDGSLFNLAQLMCGSEGTLALIVAIRLKLSPLVGGKALACIHFDSLDAALGANMRLLAQDGVAACELVDAHVLHAAAGHPGQSANCAWVVGDPAAVLVAEFFGVTAAEARARAERAAATLKGEDLGIAWPVLDGVEAPRVWALRKAGLGLLAGLRQRARPVAVIEDSAVPVSALPEFARDIGQMMARHGIGCVYYGHASVGLLHLRPALDLDTDADRATFRCVAQEMVVLVKRYRGALSGEHGDGRLRAPYLREFLGYEVYALLGKIKTSFDPDGIFNPGKIISDLSIDANLRQRPHAALVILPTGFDWQANGGFDLALERCNGSGNCRQSAGRGAMCPTFQASGQEIHSTRGRANLLRQAFSHPGPQGLDDPELAEAMDTCLSCKACKSECPSGVDMAQMKAEYLYRRRLGRLWLPGRWLMALQPQLLTLFAALSPVWRTRLGSLLRTPLMMRLTGLERKPPLPAPVALSCQKGGRTKVGSLAAKRTGQSVLLLVDPYTNHLEPEIGEAAISVLQHLGYTPKLHFMDCSLRLLVSEGFLDEAKAGLNRLRDELIACGEMPVIGLEPAELLLLRDEAFGLLRAAWPASLAGRCFLLDEFLLHEHAAGRLQDQVAQASDYSINVHPHCHERASGGASTMVKLFAEVFGLRTEIISTGCCGMGGSFGYHHDELSNMIFQNNVHLPANIGESSPLLISGISCRHQFRNLSDAEPLHLAQLLRNMLVKAQSGDSGCIKI
jgi:FAD/FMN-containing dehydrogenase/Fe-S oxidoreductase